MRTSCATVRIILQRFNSVGHVIREEIEKTELLTDGRTPDHFIRLSRRDDLKLDNFEKIDKKIIISQV